GGNLSAVYQITHILIPALAMMIVPLGISTFMFKKGENINERPALSGNTLPEYITPRFQTTLLTIGMLSLVLVPVLQSLFELPPFMGVLLGLVVLWIITDLKSARSNDPEALRLKVSTLFGKLDISTIFFFLGILMSVKALDTIGILTVMSEGLNTLFSDNRAIAFLLGVCSSFLDNVALVAATMGMYPLAEMGAYMSDSSFWTLLAYCCVTGGSILIIGSAAGVTVMGIEKISFGYYLKKFTPIIFLGYVIGALILMLFI
ncbi:MAG: sodium:proton antiporter, partial [Bacteroidales bacterium]|nr:sodium:proton antiporter [Bacteroidales bacterium]